MQFLTLPPAAAAAASSTTARHPELTTSSPPEDEGGGGRGRGREQEQEEEEEEGREVCITHIISPERMFAQERATRRGELRPGDRYAARLNPGYVGTTWWCWGDDADDDDKGAEKQKRKFSEWRKGGPEWNFGGVEKPPEEEAGWVVGEELGRLWIEVENGNVDRRAQAIWEFVE